LDSKVNVGQAL